jgi:diguanylate cyclase (GGDEF)-like protein/PAS domain S-box-containing protein
MLEALTKTTSRQRARGFLILLSLSAVLAVLHTALAVSGLVAQDLALSSALRLLGAPVAFGVIILSAMTHQGRTRRGWFLVLAAMALWAFGDLAYAFTEVVLGITPSESALLAIPYFAAALVLIVGVGFLGFGSRTKSERTALLLETGIVVISLTVVLWRVFLSVGIENKPLNALVLQLLSPVVGLGLVGFLVANLLSRQRSLLTIGLMTMGGVCLAGLIEGVDAINTFGVYTTGNPIDALVSWAYVCFAGSAVSSLLPDGRSTIERNWVRLVNSLPYAAFIVTFGVFVGLFSDPNHDDGSAMLELGVVIGLGVVAVLVGWRLALANQANSVLTNQLLESEERLQLALRGANDGLWDWNLERDTITCSPRLNVMLGYSEEEITYPRVDLQQLVHPDDVERVADEVAKHVQGLTAHLEIEMRVRYANQEYRWFLVRGLGSMQNGRTLRMAGSLTDITGRSGAYDALTGLPNRLLYRDRLERTLQRFLRYGDHFTVMFIDLNDFKIANDSLGHVMGDQLLVQVAERLEGVLRRGDTLARLGGDEFAVLAEHRAQLSRHSSESVTARALSERLIQSLHAPFTLGGRSIAVSASIGLVDSNSELASVDAFLSAADTAMYHAKNKQLGLAHFDQTMAKRVTERLELENALRRALERNELELYYQPILGTQSKQTVGFEALLRWQREHQTFVPPDVFIPIAEKSGLIVDIGAWVLRTACATAVTWPSDISISVNVSSHQFRSDNFIRTVRNALDNTGLPPERLVLEITESALLESAEVTLIALRSMGVQVQIDDFGTGYSSLSYLHRFPVSALKVDKSFVAGIEQLETREIAYAIIHLAKNLGLHVIAEGVETTLQLELLQELGCDYVQGYLFAKPMPIRAIAPINQIYN